MPIRIVIADDSPLLRESIRALLDDQKDLSVVGEAANGKQAERLVRELSPDILLLDLFMPEGSGFDVLRALESHSRVKSIVFTGYAGQLDYLEAVRLGARGFVVKGDAPARLLSAIRDVARGELAFPPDIVQGVISQLRDAPAQPLPSSHVSRLSEREREIAGLVSHGLRNRDIAGTLHISQNTVKRHIQSIFSKTGARDRTEVASLASGIDKKAA